MLKFVNFSVKFILIFLIVTIIFGFSTLWYFSIGLPDYKKLSNYQPPISSRVYSENRKLIAEYAIEKRLFIPFDSIPEKVVNSFLSAEDKNFFSHPGIDAKGILRAIIKNIKNIYQNILNWLQLFHKCLVLSRSDLSIALIFFLLCKLAQFEKLKYLL